MSFVSFIQVASGGASKKPKVEKVGPPQSLAEWISLWQSNGLSGQTAPILKAFCKERGLPVSGKKDDLIARLHDHLSDCAAEDNAARAKAEP